MDGVVIILAVDGGRSYTFLGSPLLFSWWPILRSAGRLREFVMRESRAEIRR